MQICFPYVFFFCLFHPLKYSVYKIRTVKSSNAVWRIGHLLQQQPGKKWSPFGNLFSSWYNCEQWGGRTDWGIHTGSMTIKGLQSGLFCKKNIRPKANSPPKKRGGKYSYCRWRHTKKLSLTNAGGGGGTSGTYQSNQSRGNKGDKDLQNKPRINHRSKQMKDK